MRSGIRRLVDLSIILGVAAVTFVTALVAATPYAYAEHETRTINLQESGVDLWIIGLTLGLVVLGLILFAAVMLVWERKDASRWRERAKALRNRGNWA